MDEIITLDHGSGGAKTSALINDLILKHLGNETLSQLLDGAVIGGAEKIVFSTDSFVVSPYFFPGGNIGKLCVCGTVNDISVSGGRAAYLSLGLILEEGLRLEDLEKIIISIAETAEKAGVQVVTGDTKVVERGKGDGIYINTAGIGLLKTKGLSPLNIREGDAVLVSGNVGDHGCAVMLSRNENLVEGNIASDCALINGLTEGLSVLGEDLRVMRDPTRGGLATTLCEFVEGGEYCIELDEESIPVSGAVSSACDILGLDPLYLACEGRLIAVTAQERAEEALSILQSTEGGENSRIIGKVTRSHPGRVILKTGYGSRILTKLSGEQLPRIC